MHPWGETKEHTLDNNRDTIDNTLGTTLAVSLGRGLGLLEDEISSPAPQGAQRRTDFPRFFNVAQQLLRNL